MIKTKKDLKEYISADNNFFNAESGTNTFTSRIVALNYFKIKRYLKLLRKSEYHLNNSVKSHYHTYMYWFSEWRKNRFGNKIGVEIYPNCFGKGLQVWHTGIVVNPEVRAGENCILHGGNCIGNKGTNMQAPKLGDNVDVGFGAVIIGDITINNKATIGANAVVAKDVGEGDVVVGVPAKKIK